MTSDTLRKILVIIAGVALADSVPQSGWSRQEVVEQANCETYSRNKVPKYRVAKTIPLAVPGLDLYVSVAPPDFERDKLLTLSCTLGKLYADKDMLFVWIFDNRHAARQFDAQGEGNDRRTNLSRRARYSFSRVQNHVLGQSLDLWLDPVDHPRPIHIDLGPPPPRPSR